MGYDIWVYYNGSAIGKKDKPGFIGCGYVTRMGQAGHSLSNLSDCPFEQKYDSSPRCVLIDISVLGTAEIY